MSNPAVPAIVAWSSRWRIAVLIGVGCLVLASAEGARRLSFDADILALLPQHGRAIPAFREFLARFGTLDQLYVIFTTPDGRAIDDYRDEIDAWIEGLKAAPEIAAVEAGVVDRSRDLGWLADRLLLLLDAGARDEALRRLEPAALTQAVGHSRELLTVPSAEVAELVRQDPAGLLSLLKPAGGMETGLSGAAASSGYVTADGRSRIVIARPRRPPFDSEFSRALDQRLQAIAAGVKAVTAADAEADPLPPLRVEFAGGHRVALETEALVRRESIVNSAGSLVVILPLLFIVFRSGWLVAVGALPSTLSLVLVLGGLGFAGAQLSTAGTGAGAMLFGLGIDGVVLLYVAYLTPAGSADTASRISGPATSMLLGMWTTAATFYGLMFVDFPSLQQLGMLVGHSMVICGILTLLLVPALLPRQAPRERRRTLGLPRLAGWISARRRLILVTAAVLTAVLGLAARGLRIDASLERLRSDTEAARLEERVGSAFGLPTTVYVVLDDGVDLDALLETNERLTTRLAADLPDLRVQAASWFLPSDASQTRAIARITSSGLSPAAVRQALERAGAEHGFRPGSFAPFSERLPRLLGASQRLTYDDYVSHGLADLIARFVVRDGGHWKLATYVLASNDDQVARVQWIVDQVDPHQTLTGLPLVNRDLAAAFVPEFLKGLGVGAALVLLLVVAAFRDWRLSLFALAPTAIGLIWTAGILALVGVQLDLFAAFAVVTLLGIGVDYGVHLVHRHQERGDAAAATAELAPVILVAAIITIVGYGTLVTSSYPPLRSIGLVSVVSVLALAAASVLVLPALLLPSTVTKRDV